MTVAVVRDAGLKILSNFSGTSEGSFPSLPSVGNHVIVGISNYSTTSDGVIADVTDNQGHDYLENREHSEVAGDNSAAIYSVKVATSSGTYTMTVDPTDASGNYIAWTAVEVSGLDATTHLDRTGINNSSAGDATVTASAANTTNDGIAIGVASVSSADNDINIGDVPPTNYTNIQVNEDSLTYIGFSMVYKIYNASETSTAQWTHDNTSQSGWAAVICTYKAAVGNTYNDAFTLSKILGVSDVSEVTTPDKLIKPIIIVQSEQSRRIANLGV